MKGSRLGLSMLETSILVALIGVLCGMLLPAIQTSREVARSNQCRHRLGQLILAVQAYEADFARFPAGTTSRREPVSMFPGHDHQNWLVRVTPYLDGGSHFAETFDYGKSVYALSNRKLGLTVKNRFLQCPSSWYDGPNSHFVGIHDGRKVPIDSSNRGAFIANRFLVRDDFPDGLGHTMFLSEIFIDPNAPLPSLGWMSGTSVTLRTTGLDLALNVRSNPGAIPGVLYSETSSPYGAFRSPAETEAAMIERLRDAFPDDADEIRRLFEDNQIDAVFQLHEQQTETLFEPAEKTASEINADDELEMWEMEDAEFRVLQASSSFPTVPLGEAARAPLPIGSFHGASTFNAALGDGTLRSFSNTIDPQVRQQLGIRDDHRPLTVPGKQR